jgi:hypothetical protein
VASGTAFHANATLGPGSFPPLAGETGDGEAGSDTVLARWKFDGALHALELPEPLA